jgi:two-component system, NarL family, response regulator NreC
MSVAVLLADDHRIMREGLRSLLAGQQGVTVIGEADDGRNAVSLAAQLLPDVLVMDVAMPNLNGIEATRQIVAKTLKTKVLGLSMHADARFVAEMFKAGAWGYLLKDSAFEELTRAIRTVMDNKIYISPAIGGALIETILNQRCEANASPTRGLTAREREVLQLLAEGASTKEMAERLNVSLKTIETHRQNIMKRLGLHSVAELTKYAIREGLTDLEK